MPATNLHVLPLSLAVSDPQRPDKALEWSCDLPGVVFKATPEGFHIEIQQKLRKESPRSQYIYIVPDPEPTENTVYYATIFSGRAPDKMVRWVRNKGISYSPRFTLADGEHLMTVIAVVVAEPRIGRAARSPINGPTQLAAPGTVYYAKSHTKTDGVGGGDE